MIRKEDYEFIYFFNAGYDHTTNECDLEGSDVYKDGHFIGILKWITPKDANEMTDEELEESFNANGILA